jgi:hypothetical protein
MAIDAVPRQSKRHGDSPVLQPVENEICSLHVILLLSPLLQLEPSMSFKRGHRFRDFAKLRAGRQKRRDLWPGLLLELVRDS